MTSMLIRFRTPVGEELTDEHVEKLEYAGVNRDNIYIERPGVISVELEFEDDDPDDEVEAWAEDILGALPNLEFVDYSER